MKLSFAVVIFLASTLKLKIKVFYGFYQTMASIIMFLWKYGISGHETPLKAIRCFLEYFDTIDFVWINL